MLKTVGVRLEPETVRIIDELAKEQGMTRSEFVRQTYPAALEDFISEKVARK